MDLPNLSRISFFPLYSSFYSSSTIVGCFFMFLHTLLISCPPCSINLSCMIGSSFLPCSVYSISIFRYPFLRYLTSLIFPKVCFLLLRICIRHYVSSTGVPMCSSGSHFSTLNPPGGSSHVRGFARLLHSGRKGHWVLKSKHELVSCGKAAR